MSNFHTRLDAIEAALTRLGNNEETAWPELRSQFEAESTDNSALIGTLASYAGTRSLRRLLQLDGDDSRFGSLVGKLRREVGRFCRRHRYRCPEATVVHLRAVPGMEDQSIVTTTPESDTPFIQIFQSGGIE